MKRHFYLIIVLLSSFASGAWATYIRFGRVQRLGEAVLAAEYTMTVIISAMSVGWASLTILLISSP